MKIQKKNKRQNQSGILISFIFLLSLVLMIGAELWSKNFAAIVYLALIVASPILVLLISDWRESQTFRG